MSNYSTAVLADSPVVFLQLDEATGTSAADSGSNATAWTYQTGVTLAQAPVFPDGGYSVLGSGSAALAKLGSIPASIAPVYNTSIEVSVNLPTTSQKGVFAAYGGAFDGWGIGVGSGSFGSTGNNLILGYGLSTKDTGVAIGTGAHLITVTVSSSGVATFYVDGTRLATIYSFGVTSATSAMYVGNNSQNQYIGSTVNVDNVSFYATALTASQVLNHWTAAASTLPPAPGALSFASVEATTTPTSTPVALSYAGLEAATVPTASPVAVSFVALEAMTTPPMTPVALSTAYLEVLTPSQLAAVFVGWGIPL